MDDSPRLAVDLFPPQSESEQPQGVPSATGPALRQLDEGLVTGHAGIDNDHRHLYLLVDNYQKAIETEQGDAVASQVLCDLATYAAGHFEREEGLMRRIRYPEAEAHRAEHDGFLASLGELVTAYETGCPGVPADILAFLRHWMDDHLIGWDQRLVAYINALRDRRQLAATG